MPDKKPFDNNLQSLKRVLEAFDTERVTKEEFDALATQIVDLVKTIKEKHGAEMQSSLTGMHQFLNQMKSETSQENSMNISAFQSKLEETMNKMMLEHEAMMAECDAKIQSIKDGMDGADADEQRIVSEVLAQIPENKIESTEIRDTLESLTGDERLDVKAIKGLENIETRLSTVESRRIPVPRSNNSTKFFQLTPDGSTKIFSVPKGLSGIVIGSDFPTVLMENAGFTINATRTQITLTVTTAPTSGSQLLYMYTSIFN